MAESEEQWVQGRNLKNHSVYWVGRRGGIHEDGDVAMGRKQEDKLSILKKWMYRQVKQRMDSWKVCTVKWLLDLIARRLLLTLVIAILLELRRLKKRKDLSGME